MPQTARPNVSFYSKPPAAPIRFCYARAGKIFFGIPMSRSAGHLFQQGFRSMQVTQQGELQVSGYLHNAPHKFIRKIWKGAQKLSQKFGGSF